MSTTLLSVASKWNQPEICGVMSMLGASHSGLVAGRGSGSVTSTAAPARCPDSKAATKSAATTRSPRPPLAKKAPGFIAAKNSAFARPRVSGVLGIKDATMSASAKRSGRASMPSMSSNTMG